MSISAMRECRRRATADDREGLLNKGVILERGDHEQCEINAPCPVALEDGIADVPAPDREPLALPLLQGAAAYDCPTSVAGKDAAARLNLVLEVRKASKACNRTKDSDERCESPRVLVQAGRG